MLPYKQSENGIILDTFRDGITWEMIYNLYVFDRKLRILVFDAIERLEIAIRTQIIYQLSHKYGSHWQDRQDIFNPPALVTLRNGKTVTIDVYNDIQNTSRNNYITTRQKYLFNTTETNMTNRKILHLG